MPKDISSQIERLVTAGFALHWLHPKSKRPIGNDWAAKPVSTLEQLKRDYRDGNNIGVRLGKWSVVADLFLHIIDFDVRNPATRDEALARLKEIFPEIDVNTFPTVISGSGGASRHFYFLTDKHFSPRKFAHSTGFQMVHDEVKDREVKKWDWELHLLGTGSQAAIPPSIHPDTSLPYTWQRQFDFDMLELGFGPIVSSEAVERVVGHADEEGEIDPNRTQPLGYTPEQIIAILDQLDPAEWFEDRNQWLLVGMAIHHETGGSIWGLETWNYYSRTSEKFDFQDQERTWKSFKDKQNKKPFRFASLVAVVRDERILSDFEEMPEVDDLELGDGSYSTGMFDDIFGGPVVLRKPSKSQIRLKQAEIEFELGVDAPKWVVRLNKLHAVARVSSKTVVIDIHPNGSVTYGSVNDLHNYYENDRRPKDDTTVPITKLWMQHKARRQYPNGIVFAPNKVVEGAYNHWQGFSVQPDGTKSCRLFLKHLFEIFCAGNEEHYLYILGWLAHMIQKPEEKPGVAIIAKGKKRIGKDTVFEYVGGLFFNHYITVGNQEQLTGKFNGHQERCLLVHMQEGFWAGDKRQEGALKYLITSNDVMIEPKGMNAFPIKSVLRLFMSSNERWVIPATEDEGRFFVVNVSDRRRNDHKYFAALRHEMTHGGREALLDFLMNYDLTGFQVRDVPNTDALAEQKIEGLKNVERWWHGVLQHGSMKFAGVTEEQWAFSSVNVDKIEFRDGYSRWLHSRRFDGQELNSIEFSRRLRLMLSSLAVSRPRDGIRRSNTFVIPSLGTARAEFEQMLGSQLIWPDDSRDFAMVAAPVAQHSDLEI